MEKYSDIQFIFIRFLKENSLYNQFITNASGRVRVGEYLKRRAPSASTYIGAAFSWYGTKEGDAFWMAMDAKWKEILFRYAPFSIS